MNAQLKIRILLLVTLSFGVALQTTSAQEWTRFRGPNGTGISKDIGLPNTWSDDDYQWKVKLAGTGTSSAVLWGDKIFVTSCNAKSAELFIQCLNAGTGEEVWKRSFESKAYRQHRMNSFASGTPAVDADHVYFTKADPEHTMLIALDHSGKDAWKRDFGKWQSQHGFAASPMLYDDKVIFLNSQQAERLPPGQSPAESHVVAVHKKDGTDAWALPLKATRTCYAIPCVLKVDGKPDQLIGANTGDGFFSLDPKTGKMNWSSAVLARRTVGSPIVAGGMLFASSGSGGGNNELVAIGTESESRKAPEKKYSINRAANYVPTALAVGPWLYLCGDKGILSCVEIETGEVKYQKRVGRGFSSSPIASGDKIFATDQAGVVHVIQSGPEFKQLGKNDLGEPSAATPAIADGRIFFRSDSHLMALAGEKAK